MSIWSKIIETIGGESRSDEEVSRDASRYAFVDLEVGIKDRKIHDIGILRWDGAVFHSANRREALKFLKNTDFICGHNVIHHDMKYLLGDEKHSWILVDTLYMSPLLFPNRPYHHLLKDDKLMSEQMNNPVNDCVKARDLMMDELAEWNSLTDEMKRIYATLLYDVEEFHGFMTMTNADVCDRKELATLIRTVYHGQICQHADLETIIIQQPVELAFALALISTTEHNSITPPWVLHHYPNVEAVVHRLRHSYCLEGCDYCKQFLNVNYSLKQIF